jgi:hypothetical protein
MWLYLPHGDEKRERVLGELQLDLASAVEARELADS